MQEEVNVTNFEERKSFTKADCCRSMYDKPTDGTLDNAGRVCIIPLEKLRESYRKPEYQLFRLHSCSGVDLSPTGNACYGYFCVDGEPCRREKCDFLGVGNEDVEKYAEELESKWKE